MRALGKCLGVLMTAIAVTFVTGSSVFGQQQPTELAAEQEERRGPPPEIEEITVTGSYIRGAATDGPSPVDVVQRTELERLGVPRLSDALNRLPYNLGNEGRSGDVFRGNTGGNAGINLRGLGQSRSLILLDGKRSTLSGDLSGGGNPFITIQQFPKILIQRVEILKEGGAATYGSDAMAGVANFITRRNFEGLEIRSDYLTTAESSAHTNRNVEALYGWTSDEGRTHFTIAGAYYEQDKFRSGQRGFTNAFRPGTSGFGASRFGSPGAYILVEGFDMNPLLSDGVTPNPVIGRPLATIPLFSSTTGQPLEGALDAVNIREQLAPLYPNEEELLSWSLVGGGSGLDVLGAQVIGDPDCEQAGGTFFGSSVLRNCGYAFVPFFDLAPKLKRYNVYTQFSHEFSENLEFWADFGHYRGEGDRIGVSPSFPILLFTRDTRVSASHPGNFMGSDIIGRFRPLATLFGGIGDVRPEADGHSNVQRYIAGFKGDLPDWMPLLNSIGENWRYEVSAMHNRQLDDGSAPDQSFIRWGNSLMGYGGPNCPVGTRQDAFLTATQDIVLSDGTVVPAHGIEPGTQGCEYWNPFGSAITNPDHVVTRTTSVLTGEELEVPVEFRLGNTQEMWRWFSNENSTATTTSLTVYDWLVAGDLLELPTGPLGLAFGMQWRNEEYDVSRSANAIVPIGELPDFTFLQGGDVFRSDQDVWSVFGELSVPLHDRVDMQLALRHEDYGGSIGKSLDPKLAIRWLPTDTLTLRASLSTTFRAPSLSQQRSNRAGLNLFFDSIVRPGPDGAFGTGDETRGLGFGWKALDAAGNPNLKPEEAIVFNAGVIGQDFLVDGLNLTMDYYRIKMDDTLGTRSSTRLLAFENGINIGNGFGWPINPDPIADDQFINATGAPGRDNIPDSVCVSLDQVDAAGGNCFFNDPRIMRLYETGELFRVQVVYDNFSTVTTDGIDLSGAYTWVLPGTLGDMTFAFSGSHIIQYKVDGGAADLFSGEAAGNANNENFVQALPKYKVYLTLFWDRDNQSAFLNWNHISPYENDNQGNDKISQWTTVDLGYGYEFETVDARLTLGIQNVFGQDPPFMPEDLNFDSFTHDPYGRKFTANLVWRWSPD